ncbi:hypothetical protein MTO96_008020 [Rhipicephalus appendiculatus]
MREERNPRVKGWRGRTTSSAAGSARPRHSDPRASANADPLAAATASPAAGGVDDYARTAPAPSMSGVVNRIQKARKEERQGNPALPSRWH